MPSSIQFLSEDVGGGVAERRFDIVIDGQTVPGIIWAPENAAGTRPLLLMGHGGTQHKRIDTMVSRARTYVRHHGYAVVAIDAPGHGERISKETQVRQREERQLRAASGNLWTPALLREMAERTTRAVGEWKATLDAVEKLDYVGQGPAGYWGVSMGTAIGVPFIAGEPRVKAAVLGLAGLRPGATDFEKAARSITIPLIFSFQWDDEVASRDTGIALYDAFGSNEKSMHVNPGPHMGIPPWEREHWEMFFVRHLGSATA
jgi:pimeloyl-ACP methyl ester carboxylesterase